MKIIIVVTSPNFKYGSGMNRVIYNSKDEFEKQFKKVIIISANNIIELLKGLYKIIRNNPFSFEFIIFNSMGSISKRLNRYWLVYLFLSRIFMYKKVIYWHEMPDFYKNYRNIQPKDYSKINQKIKKTNFIHFFVSIANSKLLENLGINDQPIVVNNCIIKRDFPKSLMYNKFTVVTVGRVETIKGTDIWTEVAINVCKMRNDVQFLWCGDNTERELFNKCKNRVNEENLNGQIFFLGHLEDASGIISSSHLYYSSSRVDSFPLSVLEAMMLGKNIVYYNSGGIVEAVLDDGIFVPNFDIQLTTKVIILKIDEFKKNKSSIYNVNLETRFKNNFTPEIFVGKFKNMLIKSI